MRKVIAGMTMSLDGFINDSNGSAESLSPDFSEMLESVRHVMYVGGEF